MNSNQFSDKFPSRSSASGTGSVSPDSQHRAASPIQSASSALASSDFRQRISKTAPVSSGRAPSRLDALITALNAVDIDAQPVSDEPNTLRIALENEDRFRLVAPPTASFFMLVADVFTGTDGEIAQMAPSLLHANYTCQRMAIENPLKVTDADLTEDESMWLPVMGLDLNRMAVVLTLQIPAKRLADSDFADFIGGLLETITQDADMLVNQFRALIAGVPGQPELGQ